MFIAGKNTPPWFYNQQQNVGAVGAPVCYSGIMIWMLVLLSGSALMELLVVFWVRGRLRTIGAALTLLIASFASGGCCGGGCGVFCLCSLFVLWLSRVIMLRV